MTSLLSLSPVRSLPVPQKSAPQTGLVTARHERSLPHSHSDDVDIYEGGGQKFYDGELQPTSPYDFVAHKAPQNGPAREFTPYRQRFLPAAPFLTQLIFQQQLGSGLYYEPYDAALSAYATADALGKR
jgi:hypothetical protein